MWDKAPGIKPWHDRTKELGTHAVLMWDMPGPFTTRQVKMKKTRSNNTGSLKQEYMITLVSSPEPCPCRYRKLTAFATIKHSVTDGKGDPDLPDSFQKGGVEAPWPPGYSAHDVQAPKPARFASVKELYFTFDGKLYWF